MFQIVPIEAEESTYTASVKEEGGTLNVSASAPDGVLPEDAKLVVTPIVNDGNDSLYEDTANRLNEQAEKDKQTVDAFIAYDLQFEKDGKEVEPQDGRVTVTMNWDTAVKPEGVQGDEKISVVHLKDEKTLENLSSEKDDQKNHASVETDEKDSEALTKAEITSDSFSVYALEWTIDNVSSITVHYTDENGNEISPADTVDAPADAGIDTFAKAIDGYAYASASVDETNATELKTENGRLSFNDGTNWNQASSTDVYLKYTAVPAEESAAETPQPEETTAPEETPVPQETAEPEATPAPENTADPSSDPAVTEDNETTLNASTKNNKYNVTVTYGKDAGLPDGTTLSVKTISKDNDEYENAKNAVAASRKVDADALGMTALDITLKDKDGNKVEPKDHSRVKVSISAEGLPSDAGSVDIHHITENKAESSNAVSNALHSIARSAKKAFTGTTDQAEEVMKNVAVTDGQAVADFEVSSFSTFTITWTTTINTRTARFAQVKLHYVDEDGNELADPTNAPTSEMLSQSENGVITLKNYAEDSDNASRMANYTYKEARLSNAKTGTVVTGFLGKETTDSDNKKTYSLKYATTDPVPAADASDWTNIPADAITGTSNNSVDVYLIYTENPHITVHYVNKNREEIAPTSVKYADDLTTEALVSSWSQDPLTGDDGTHYTRKGTYLGKTSGTSISSIYSVQSALNAETKEYTLQYKTSADAGWQDLSLTNGNANVYVVYEEEPSFTIHYVNEIGTEIASSTTKYADSIDSEEGVAISSDTANWAKAIDNYTYKDAHLTNYTGKAVTHVRAVRIDDSFAYKIQVKSGDSGSWEDTNSRNVYLVYDKTDYKAKLNVHYMDIGGEPIKDASGNDIVRVLDVADYTSLLDLTNGAQRGDFNISLNGYGTFPGDSFNNLNDDNSSTGIALVQGYTENTAANVTRGDVNGHQFRYIQYSDNTLKVRFGNSSYLTLNKDASGAYNLYLMYVPHLTIHYVDSDGNELYSDNITNKSIQWGNSVSNNSATLSDYYNGHGTPDHIYDALPTATDKNEITTLKWGHSTSGENNNHWLTTLTLKDSTSKSVNGLVKDVYMVYDKTVTVHHVDENGNKLADDTKAGIVSGTNMTSSSFAKSISGYVVDGAYFVDPKTDAGAKSLSSITYTKDGDTWTSSATFSDGSTDTTDHNEIWVVYKQASMQDVKNGITIHYVDEDGHTVAADKVVSTSSWPVDTSSTTWGWNGTGFITRGSVTNDYLPTNPALGQPNKVYLGAVADGREFTLGSGNRAINFKYDSTSGWQTGIDSTSAATAPANEKTYKGLIMELTFVYPAHLNVTVHHVDGSGNKIAEDTQKTVSSSASTALKLSDFQTTATNYTASSLKYGSTNGSEFTNITFSKNAGAWQYKLDSSDAVSITGDTADVYVVYTKNDNNMQIIIHFTDENGNKLADDYTITNAIQKPTSNGTTVSGWRTTTLRLWDGQKIISSAQYKKASSNGNTFKGEYIGPTFNVDENKLINSTVNGTRQIQYYWDNDIGKWYTSQGNNDNSHYALTDTDHVFEGFIDNIYWVFNKSNADKNLHVHYMHVRLDDKENIVRDANGDPQYELYTTDQLVSDYPSTISYDDVLAAGDAGIDLTDTSPATYAKPISITRGGKLQTDNYYGSYLGTPRSATDQLPDYALISSDGPHISKVRVQNDQYQFLTTTGVTDENATFTQVQRKVWTYTTTAGRTFTLRQDSNGNFSIVDSDGGLNAFDLNLVSSDENTNIYKTISGAQGTGVEFTVIENKENPNNPTYKLTVQEWIQIPQHDIYQLYVNENSPLVNVGDEIIYSGNLVARTTHFPSNATIVSYKWEKQVNGGPWQEVTRSRNGNDWNIANDLKDRSWLNLVADNGELSEDEKRTEVKYRVTLTYTEDGKTKTATSAEYNVPYWDQLQNGSFEIPSKQQNNANNISYEKPTKENTYYSNAEYKQYGGVWQTTGPGDNIYKKDTNQEDIEIINTKTDTNYLTNYGWPQGSAEGAKDGDQFAELNAQKPGALYQDVVTHPNEYLNYWLSHRARGGSTRPANNDKPKFDTMYLVIMPTRLAMTSGSNGGELKTQADLQDFIDKHAEGGYSTNLATKEENTVVCRDTNSGILIARISSDNQDWHSINVTNGYIATSTLTRFFFVAGKTSAGGDNTLGNMLDDVGFSQKLQTPTTPHYHMVVEKTFTGLSTSDVAKLAGNFQLKIDEYAKDQDNKTYSPKAKDIFDYSETNGDKKEQSLNGAVLGFTVDGSNNFKLTATGVDPNITSVSSPPSPTVDLFKTEGNTGVVNIDPVSGTVRMRWTLANNYFSGSDSKYFQVTESGADVDGYADNASNTASTVHKDATSVTYTSEAPTKTGYIEVKDQDTALANFTNDYSDNSQNEPDQIRVQKTFTGITPSVVDQLTGSATPFEITICKPITDNADEPDNNSSITLIGNEDKPAKNYPAGVDRVTLDTKQNDDGSSTYTWTIYGTKDGRWISGNKYYVKEANYEPTANNPITGITLNGNSASTISNGKVVWNGEYQSVSVGTSDDIPTLQTNENDKAVSVPESNNATLATNTYLIIAQYTLETSGSTTTHYLVWTQDTMSVNEKATIRKLISDEFNSGTAVDADIVGWRSGKNPGKMEIDAHEADNVTKGSMSYDSTTGTLSFTDSTSDTGAKWQSYYSMVYNQANIPNNREKTTEIRIKNSYEPAVRIMKIRSGENPTPLQGAEFKLYTYVADSSGASTTSKKYFGNDKQFNVDASDAVTFQTNSEGVAVGKLSDSTSLEIINSLSEGTYYLEETKAPAGYNMPVKNVVAIKVNSDGIVTQITDTKDLPAAEKDKINISTSGDDEVTVDWNSPYYTIAIRNTPGVLLPITGGIGVWPFIFTGFAMIMVASYLLWRRRRSKLTADKLMDEIRRGGDR